jgi:hypothetical protein
VFAAAAVVALAACGAADRSNDVAAPIVSGPVAPTPLPTAPIDRIDEPATVTSVADRVDDALQIAWIGGSELELDDRSLPDAVAARNPVAGDRPLHVFADTKIAPLPREVAARVERAAERNMDGLVVILNPSWLSWDGHTECSGIALPHDFYACVLTPQPETDVAALRAEVRELIDTIVRTGLPAYVYVIPHSAESLADPALAPLLAATEAQFTDLDPAVARIEFIGHIVSRDLEPLREGAEFNDMVHPSASGVERLADFFTGEFARVFER